MKTCIFTCWKKKLPDQNEEIYNFLRRNVFLLKRNVPFAYGMLHPLNESAAHKACFRQVVLQEKDACLIIACSNLQCFHCPFPVWEKTLKIEWDLFQVESLLFLETPCREVEVRTKRSSKVWNHIVKRDRSHSTEQKAIDISTMLIPC